VLLLINSGNICSRKTAAYPEIISFNIGTKRCIIILEIFSMWLCIYHLFYSGC